MEKFAMEKDLAEVVRRMNEFYHEHGAHPADSAHDILGDQRKVVTRASKPKEPKP